MPVFLLFILLLIGFCIIGPLYLIYGAVAAILSAPTWHTAVYIIAVVVAFYLGRVSV